jgi:hypothetical protein
MALKAITLPRAVTILPFPAETMLDSLTPACLRFPAAPRNVTLLSPAGSGRHRANQCGGRSRRFSAGVSGPGNGLIVDGHWGV